MGEPVDVPVEVVDVETPRDDMDAGALEVLFSIQQSLRVPKSERNEFGRYNYRNVEAILSEAKKAAAPYHAAIVCSDSIELVGGRHYVRSTVTLMTRRGKASASALAREAETRKGMDPGQITGACISYARKYAAQGLFAISGEGYDLDSLPPAEPERAPASYPEGRFEAKCRRCGRIGHNLSAQTATTWKCPDCGDVDWEPV